MSREENLERLLGFHSPDPSTWERPDELPRWAAVERDGFWEQAWIAFFDTLEEARGYFFSGEGPWFPALLYDLDTGQAFEVEVKAEVGKEVVLR